MANYRRKLVVLRRKGFSSSNFSFDRMDPPNPRAIFAYEECTPKFRKKRIARLRSRLAYGNPPHNALILVQVRHEVSDTPIPGLEVNFGRLELSCGWRGAYNAFFRKERQCKIRMSEETEAKKERILEMRAQIERGEMNETDALGMVLNKFCESLDRTRKILRRERVLREISRRRASSGRDTMVTTTGHLKDYMNVDWL